MLKELMGNPYVWAAITIFSIYAGVVTIVGKELKELSMACFPTIILEKGKTPIPKLQIEYDGNSINELTISNFYIWNSGNKAIRWDDIATKDVLSISNTGCAQILDAKILKSNNTVNSVSIFSSTRDSVEIGFEYLDPKDGMIIQIAHTGSSEDLDLKGTIKDKGIIKDRSLLKRKAKEDKKETIIDVALAILPCLCALSEYLLILHYAPWFKKVMPNFWIGGPVLAVAVIGLPILTVYLLSKLVKMFNKKRGRVIPESLIK